MYETTSDLSHFTQRPNYSYNAGWLATDGTFVCVDQHADFRNYEVNFKAGYIRLTATPETEIGIDLGSCWTTPVKPTRAQFNALCKLVGAVRPTRLYAGNDIHEECYASFGPDRVRHFRRVLGRLL